MSEKTVSVYINAYNAEKFIVETVNAILNQSYKNIKLVVIDDCSTDQTLDRLAEIKDERLTVYSLPQNSHIATALNEGLKYMDGDYIAHCDADDVWEKDKIQKQLDFLESHPEYGACFSKISVIDENGKPKDDPAQIAAFNNIDNMTQPEMIYYFCNKLNHLHHSSFFARKEIVEKLGSYDLSMPTLHDYDYWLRLMLITPIYIFEEPLMRYRIHGKNHSYLDEAKLNSHDAEHQRAVTKCIENCPDDMFLEAFKDDLYLKGEHTKEETRIEKALILEKVHTSIYYNPVSTVEAVARLINDPVYYALLKEKFGFTAKKFNELQTVRQYHKQSIEDDLNEQILHLQKEVIGLKGDVAGLTTKLSILENGFSWRVTRPLRFLSTSVRNRASKHRRLLRFLILTKSFIKGGPKGVKQKKIDLAAMTPPGIKIPHTISKTRRKEEESFKFDKDVKISILVPLYNTPLVFLKEMIDSVLGQTYKNWELCLADGSTDDFDFVGKYCTKLAAKDKRIKYEKLTENLGISENTNQCLSMATGDYIALFDHDDYLHPSALFEVMKCICDGADYIYTDEVTFLEDDFDKIITCHFKPDFAPDNLLANNYICHFSVFKSSLVTSDKLFRTEYDGSQDHDLILRLTDAAEKIEHIQKPLYFWRSHNNSVAMNIGSKEYAIKAGIKAVYDFLSNKGVECSVESSPAFPTIYRIRYELTARPKVSIIIPNRNHFKDLSNCINSILELSTYDNYEIIIVDNQSTECNIKNYYANISSNEKIRIINYDKPFNYSAINNFAVSEATGEYILLLNNDTKVITPEWIEELLMYAQREDVGAVGAKLYHENDTVQHGGIILGIGDDRVAGHSHYGCSRENSGYMGKMYYAQDVSAVTAACLMVKKSMFNEVGGLDEGLAVAFNDVDFCLKLRELGKLIIFNPFCELYHFESASRGSDKKGENKERFKKEKEVFLQKWGETIKKGDPYYNPNLSLDISYDLNV